MAKPFTSPQWAIWVQPNGPNTEVYYLGCHTLDDLSESGGGIKDLIRCFKPDGTGWEILGRTINPPDPISTTITGLIEESASWLERILERGNCPFPLYINGKSCPPYDVFSGAKRWYAIEQAEIGPTSLTNLAHREEDNISEQAFEITGFPPVLRGRAVQSDRLGMTGFTNNFNDIASACSRRCAGPCGTRVDTCDILVIATDSAAAPGFANILISYDNGATWAATAADPFATGVDAKSIVSFPIDENTTRILVARESVAATAMHVAYSDDYGATWNDVTLDSTVGYGALYGGALFALDMYHIWLVITAAGGSEMFFSDDGGETWTEQTLAAPAELYYAVWFADENNGMVVGAADAIEVTTDGGNTWTAATATGSGDDMLTVCENEGGGIWWIGSDGGDLWYSNDHGATWAQRNFPGYGTGKVFDIEFVTPTVGFMTHSPSAASGRVYRTRNGGYSWELESATVDGELYSIHACSINQAFTVGEVGTSPATALLLKTHD